jgi:Helix-hairpin-helix motif
MAPENSNRIDINHAGVKRLTQLPGIAKNVAYKIVNHRQRHGLFTAWEELLEVKDFPAAKLALVKTRAALICTDEGCGPPRHVNPTHVERFRKKPTGFNRALRATHSPAKLHGPTTQRPH